MKFNTKLLKKLLVLSTTSVSIFSACSAKEDGDYKPYKEQDSIEVAKVEEEKPNPPKIEEKKSTLPKVKEDTEEPKKKKKVQQVEESQNKDEETNDKYPHYKDVHEDGSTVSLEQYNQIKTGMSADKVIEIAGKPGFSEVTKLFSIYIYSGHDEEGSMTIKFDSNGNVTNKEQDGLSNTVVKEEKANKEHEDPNPESVKKSSAIIPNDFCGHGHDETKELAHDCEKITDKKAYRRYQLQQKREERKRQIRGEEQEIIDYDQGDAAYKEQQRMYEEIQRRTEERESIDYDYDQVRAVNKERQRMYEEIQE
ncbi:MULTISPECIES: outer membrane protein assembly factor BamE domain-containing protein [Bacillus cereus group]|uniref:Outer membrane protein assembly factor BamE domain-containing protein n=1 Tax=Bacillus thuringiensis TaxID=1428 RepID=A0A9X6KNT4_BACTU|nr:MULTISPECIES: outer membrane protein assembly factor BamE [Bacillus cereus group]MDA2440742.1 outer membrane protein assembly factor BamE [Bacillus cereus]MDA2446721.1 outer membrane protein assembly factor BamE [Bacillus cereus]MDA2615796.1 outer membrane protein assembly factor BamE [Bacillus cereus]MEB8555341.1 outer membrane protein assembly factor BamE [Bacillus cereus]MEB8727824.1 outer membrane protein assembly factor BamE [Bacillus cereus]